MDMKKKSIVEKFFANKTRRRRMAQIAAVLSVVVVASVFWRLTQPVITLTPEPVCGKTEHAHSSACYQEVLSCGQDEGEEHSHSASCYSSVLCCGLSEHAHSDACYPQTLEEPTVVASEDASTDGAANAAPGGEASQAPAAVETSAAPTGDATLEPSQEPTEAPSEEPTEEPTAVPAPVLERLSASAERVYVGQSVSWSFAAAHADALTYKITDGTGAVVSSGSLAADVQAVDWTATAVGSYTMTVTAENESGADSASASVTVEEAAELTASVWMDARSCFAGDSVTIYMTTSGGAELSAVDLTVAQDGNVLASQQAITESVTVTTGKATGVGKLTAKLSVTDVLGTTVEASCEIPVALDTTGDADAWLRAARIDLGESWPENLLAVAETQLGYQESDVNFIIREDGSRQGYSVYGDWYGCPYEEWCAMFVSFCLDRADVPSSAFGRNASCARWISDLRYMGLYANRSDCEPAPGDLVFFDWDGDRHSDHVGIVSAVNDSEIETIEGNSGRAVRRCSYARNDSQIMGYGLLNLAYENYLEENAEPAADEPAADASASATNEPVPEDELRATTNESTAVGFEAFMAEIEALEEGDEAALTDLEDRIVAAYEAGELSDEEFAALATALYGGISTYSSGEDITISLVIRNSEYTLDAGSGSSHVQIESTDVEGLNPDGRFSFTALGTGKAYWVEGTGTLIRYTIPAGTSMSDNDLSFLKLTIANLVNNGTDSNTNRYVSPYSWVDESGKVCSVKTAFDADTTLYLSLYSESEVYYFDYCCSPDGNHSISQALSSLYPSATITIGQSVTSDYIPLAAHVNANFSDESCGFGLAYGKVFDHWYLLKSDGTEVPFTEGLQITGDYVSSEYGNAIKVYAKWVDAPEMVTVSFAMPDGSTAPAAVAINTGASLGNLMPENPTMYNCAFLGWSYDGGQTWVDSTTPITSDVTLTAVFNATVTVYTRDYAGGNTSSEIIKGTYTVQTGHSLAEAVNSAGEHITADSFLGSYMFMGWQPETDSTYTKDLSGCIVNWAMGVSEVYERVYTLSFQYTLDGVIQQAKSYYVKGGGTYYDALDMDGNALENPDEVFAAIQVPGYQFNGWLDENGSSYYPSRYNNFWQDRTFTADLTKLNVVSFRQADVADVDGDGDTEEYITIDTRYVAANQALGTAVDENGAVLAALPNAQATEEAVFSRWVATVDGEAVEVTLETVITGDLVCTAELSTDFVTVEYVYADAESGAQTAVYPSGRLLSGEEISAMPAQEALTEHSYPNGYYLTGWKVMNERAELVDVELPYVVTQDTTFYAQFEAPLTITFEYADGQEDYVIHVRAGTTFGEAMAANPEIPAPQENIEMIQDDVPAYGTFVGWTYVDVESGATDGTYVLATDALVLSSDMRFTAGYDVSYGHSIIVHDVDPDGNDYANSGDEGVEVEIELLAMPGQSLRDAFADSCYQTNDGSDGADRIWYTLDESDNRTRVDLDAEVTEDMTVYTYTYQITLNRATTDENADSAASASVLDYVLPSAEAATYVWINNEGTQITIRLAEGDTLKLSDFVIDGVDYSVYSWTYEGTTYTTSQLIAAVNNEDGALHNQNATLTQGASSLTKVQRTVNFYVCVNNNWVKIETIDYAWDPASGNKDVLSAALLESIYYDYGFRAADYQANSCVIAHASAGNDNIYFTPAVTIDGQTYARILNTGDTRNCDVYYVPTRASKTSETNAANSDFTTSDTFYTVTVLDNSGIYGEGETVPPVQYVLNGRTATVTVKVPEGGGENFWRISGTCDSSASAQNGYITYTLTNIQSAIGLSNGYAIVYRIVADDAEREAIGNAYAANTQTWVSLPTIQGEQEFVVKLDMDSTGSYEIIEPDGFTAQTRANRVSHEDDQWDFLATYMFQGWKINGNTQSTVQRGDILTREQLEQYMDANGQIVLTPDWSAEGSSSTREDTCSFWVIVNSNNTDSSVDEITTSGNYSDCLYTTNVIGGDGVTLSSLTGGQQDFLIYRTVDGIGSAVGADAAIRRLATDGYNGVKLGSFPSDEEILARLRSWSDRASNTHSITVDGVTIPKDELTTENYTIRWYVFKYDGTDGWHVDGKLVPLKGQLRIQKTFYGDSTAVAAIKNGGYSITVTQVLSSSSSASPQQFTLNLDPYDATNNPGGYTSYDSTTDTYTWALDVYQKTTYTVAEQNYTYNQNGVITYPQYSISNSGTSADGQWYVYDETTTVSATARAYPSDVNAGTIQTVGLRNSYIPTNTLVVHKTDGSTGHGLAGISFKLYELNEDTNQYVEHAVYRNETTGVYYIFTRDGVVEVADGLITTDAAGSAQIVGVQGENSAGTYKLVEVNPPTGYDAVEVVITVDGSGNVSMETNPNATLDGQTLTIRNQSKAMQLIVRKNWASGLEQKQVTMQLFGNGISMGGSYSFTLDGTTDTLETEAWRASFANMPLYVDGATFNISVKETWIGNTAASDEYADGYEDYVVQYSPLLYTYADRTSGTQPSKVNEQGETVFATSAMLVVTNSSETGDISFTKLGYDDIPLSGAEFALYTLYTEDLQDTLGTASSGANGNVTFSNVPYGVYFMMQETQAPEGYIRDATQYKVVLSADGVQIYAPTIDEEGNITYDESVSLSQIRNEPVPVDIVVKKVDNSDNTVLLSGATFQLMKKNESGTYVNEGAPLTTGADGEITITGLLPGDYQLVETAAPAGYYLQTTPIDFKIVPGAVETEYVGFSSSTDEGNVFTVPNQSGSELPQTGGSGTIPYTIGGLLIMAVALLYGYGSRRRHGRGVGSN